MADLKQLISECESHSQTMQAESEAASERRAGHPDPAWIYANVSACLRDAATELRKYLPKEPDPVPPPSSPAPAALLPESAPAGDDVKTAKNKK